MKQKSLGKAHLFGEVLALVEDEIGDIWIVGDVDVLSEVVDVVHVSELLEQTWGQQLSIRSICVKENVRQRTHVGCFRCSPMSRVMDLSSDIHAQK